MPDEPGAPEPAPIPPPPPPPAASATPAATAPTAPMPVPESASPDPALPGAKDPAEPKGSRAGGLALLATIAMVAAMSIEEDGDHGWGRIGVWAGFAVAAALATLAPTLRTSFSLTEHRAWQVAVAGAAGLAAFWILFVLPAIQQNVSFLATVACAAGIGAAWLAPGRPPTDASTDGW